MEHIIKKNTIKMMTFGIDHQQISLLAMGKGWLVVDKPAGMSVHNDAGRDLCSVAFAFIESGAAIKAQLGADPAFGIHPVHRLDKETSGVLLLAVNREMFRFFSKQFESRQVKKRYIAILHGMLINPEGDDSWGNWRWPLAGTAGGRNNPEGSGPGQESLTRYRVLGHSAHYTLVEIEPLSGRTHQIRRHAKMAGHPVVGDARYGSKRAIDYLIRNHAFDRLALHARAITLRISGAKEPKTIETPSIPNQMQSLFENDDSAQAL
jgi:RluA family pseudouridine synthase